MWAVRKAERGLSVRADAGRAPLGARTATGGAGRTPARPAAHPAHAPAAQTPATPRAVA